MPGDAPNQPASQPSALTVSDVRKVATLSRLALNDAQAEDYRSRLSAVLGYVDRLRQLDLSNVEPMAHPMETTNRFAADEPNTTGLTNDALMAIAPEKHPPFIKVPKVLGDGDGGGA